MKSKANWKSANRLDNLLNVLLIALTLGMLGQGALEVEWNAYHVAANTHRQA